MNVKALGSSWVRAAPRSTQYLDWPATAALQLPPLHLPSGPLLH